jgi:hypothetical protein
MPEKVSNCVNIPSTRSFRCDQQLSVISFFVFHLLYLVRTKDSHLVVWYIRREKQTPWSESASELYRPSDRRLSAKLLPTFADRRCHVVSVTDPYGRIPVF